MISRAMTSSLGGKPIRDLGLTIAGTPLVPILDALRAEMATAGLRRLHPHFYLSTEWGVPFETVSIAVPFFLARPDLTAIHLERTGHVEGMGVADILRYLRHELGHVVNYAYRLYDDGEWVRLFGAITQPYVEEYRPRAFSRRHVRHLPGWYAQKHPDEDWSETFAVWMTPGSTWRDDYATWPEALEKLEYCDRTIRRIGATEPLVTAVESDEAVEDIDDTLDDFYADADEPDIELPPGIDGVLRSIFEDLEGAGEPAAALFSRLEHNLVASVYRWTGHFPERTRALVRHLAARATVLGLAYPTGREDAAAVAITAFVTALAMSYVQHRSYLPS
jgi:hypothetical protein